MDEQLTREQAQQYANYWAQQVPLLTGPEQAEAQRSAAHWSHQASLLPPAAPPAKRKLLTVPVIITLVVVPLLVIGTVVGGLTVYSQRADALAQQQGPPAKKMVALYLDALIARDTKTAKFFQTDDANFGAQTASDGSGLIAGTPKAAKSVDLAVSYEIESLDFFAWDGDKPEDEASEALVTVRLTYTATAEGQPVEASGLQTISIKRDFYNAGSGENVGAVPVKADGPTVFGPWKVWAMGRTLEDSDGLDYDGEYSTSTYAASPLPDNQTLCSHPSSIMNAIGTSALQYGIIPAACFAGYVDFTNYEGDALAVLKANMIPFDAVPPGDILGLNDWMPASGFGGAPVAELSTVVQGREFVFTFFLVDSASWLDPEYPEYRVLSITERTTK